MKSIKKIKKVISFYDISAEIILIVIILGVVLSVSTTGLNKNTRLGKLDCLCENGTPNNNCIERSEIKCKSCDHGFQLVYSDAGQECLEVVTTAEGVIDEITINPENSTETVTTSATVTTPSERTNDSQQTSTTEKETEAPKETEPTTTTTITTTTSPITENLTDTVVETTTFTSNNETCSTGEYFDKKTSLCQQNKCACKWGSGAEGEECPVHSRYWCSQCNDGFHMDEIVNRHGLTEHVCNLDKCKCDNGTGSIGLACPSHQDPDNKSCRFCKIGFSLDFTLKTCNATTEETASARAPSDVTGLNEEQIALQKEIMEKGPIIIDLEINVARISSQNEEQARKNLG